MTQNEFPSGSLTLLNLEFFPENLPKPSSPFPGVGGGGWGEDLESF